jgi:hypothetical protein
MRIEKGKFMVDFATGKEYLEGVPLECLFPREKRQDILTEFESERAWIYAEYKRLEEEHKKYRDAELTKEVFANGLVRLSTLFEKVLVKERMTIYYEELIRGKMTNGEYRCAIDDIIVHDHTFPTIASFYQARQRRRTRAGKQQCDFYSSSADY